MKPPTFLAATWFVAVFGLPACGPAAAHVSVLRHAPEQDCTVLGRVQGQGTSETQARVDLRAEARALGADVVVIDAPLSREPAGRTRLEAQALRCASAGGARDETAPVSEAATAPQGGTAEEGAPEASVQDSAAGEGTRSVEARLRELQRLHAEGLITDAQYDARREQILQEL